MTTKTDPHKTAKLNQDVILAAAVAAGEYRGAYRMLLKVKTHLQKIDRGEWWNAIDVNCKPEDCVSQPSDPNTARAEASDAR